MVANSEQNQRVVPVVERFRSKEACRKGLFVGGYTLRQSGVITSLIVAQRELIEQQRGIVTTVTVGGPNKEAVQEVADAHGTFTEGLDLSDAGVIPDLSGKSIPRIGIKLQATSSRVLPMNEGGIQPSYNTLVHVDATPWSLEFTFGGIVIRDFFHADRLRRGKDMFTETLQMIEALPLAGR